MNIQQISETLGIDIDLVQEVAELLFGEGASDLNDKQTNQVDAVLSRMDSTGESADEAIAALTRQAQEKHMAAKHQDQMQKLHNAKSASEQALRMTAINSAYDKFTTFQVIEGQAFAQMMANGVDLDRLPADMRQAIEQTQELVHTAMSNRINTQAGLTLDLAMGKEVMEFPELASEPTPLMLAASTQS